ncbi:hypothetical protein [Marichromatium bheemlicum]|uniref:PilZ domain-containing protein n=1 Tax=Marichromatium bheemlicum TaxID=365339 RepID=A0ABX1IB36_9GAMM|nr:hypothetical protein [Marichromatium bheemlicum]NKN33417.1 hypothetical protein [Marichromatium bheemlicum]
MPTAGGVAPTPDLRPAPHPLAPEFPAPWPGTEVVLFETAAGGIGASWSLAAADVARVVSLFGATGAHPRLRLLRREADGDTSLVVERVLRERAPRGTVVLAEALPSADYHAEIGLADGAAGWVMLARSESFLHGRGIEVERVRRRAMMRSGNVPETGAGPVATETGEVARLSLPGVIPRLDYATPAPPAAGVVIEARLCVSGWAPPGCEIDLFGQPYRVGPGGRFQLDCVVDDPALLRAALAQHPPALPPRPEEE